jgi:hypothetical protein
VDGFWPILPPPSLGASAPAEIRKKALKKTISAGGNRRQGLPT